MTTSSDVAARPGFWIRIRRSPRIRKPLRDINRLAKQSLGKLLNLLIPETASQSLSDWAGATKVLMVRPNFRIGNTLISARLIPAVRHRFPRARIDFLAAAPMAPLLEGMGLGRIETLSRAHAYRWISLVSMIRRLRRERYDVVVDCGGGSLTSAALSRLAGARCWVGRDQGHFRRLLDVRLSTEWHAHAYDSIAAFARAIHPDAKALPHYVVADEERAFARNWLQAQGLGDANGVKPFLGVFVGGHLEKRVPYTFWAELLTRLSKHGLRAILFSGPEEAELISRLTALHLENLLILPVQSLRKTAALSACATLVVSPDTGTLHLAAALEIPVVSILQTPVSLKYAPRGPRDIHLMRPTAEEAFRAILSHYERVQSKSVSHS